MLLASNLEECNGAGKCTVPFLSSIFKAGPEAAFSMQLDSTTVQDHPGRHVRFPALCSCQNGTSKYGYQCSPPGWYGTGSEGRGTIEIGSSVRLRQLCLERRQPVLYPYQRTIYPPCNMVHHQPVKYTLTPNLRRGRQCPQPSGVCCFLEVERSMLDIASWCVCHFDKAAEAQETIVERNVVRSSGAEKSTISSPR